MANQLAEASFGKIISDAENDLSRAIKCICSIGSVAKLIDGTSLPADDSSTMCPEVAIPLLAKEAVEAAERAFAAYERLTDLMEKATAAKGAK
jgi:hypothetical protein